MLSSVAVSSFHCLSCCINLSLSPFHDPLFVFFPLWIAIVFPPPVCFTVDLPVALVCFCVGLLHYLVRQKTLRCSLFSRFPPFLFRDISLRLLYLHAFLLSHPFLVLLSLVLFQLVYSLLPFDSFLPYQNSSACTDSSFASLCPSPLIS